MMTRAQFRTVAHLTKYTWEGDHIKDVQTALHAYHTGPQGQKAQLLKTLKRSCDAWKTRHPERRRAQLSDRAWYKQEAMNRLIAEIKDESINYETYRSPSRQYKQKRGRQRFFGDQQPDNRNHHQGSMEVAIVRSNYDVKVLECREWVVGAPPPRGGDPWSDDGQVAMTMAFRAVRMARETLSKGPFNNRGGLPHAILNREQYPRWLDLLVEQQNYELLQNANNVLRRQRNIPWQEDFLLQQAFLAHCTASVGGGVCSKIASLTLGILTIIAEPETRVAQVYHNFNHEFVMVGYGDSPWIVADPWPHNSYIVPMNHCSFGDADQIGRNMFMIVHRRCRWAFGVEFRTRQFDSIRLRAQRQLERDAPKDASFHEMADNFQEDHNLDDGVPADAYWLAADRTQWGQGVFDEEDEDG